SRAVLLSLGDSISTMRCKRVSISAWCCWQKSRWARTDWLAALSIITDIMINVDCFATNALKQNQSCYIFSSYWPVPDQNHVAQPPSAVRGTASLVLL